MTTALFAGRFQPFHNGHLQVALEALRNSDKLIIVIGSADVSHIPDNPFTAGERYCMIYDSLREHDVPAEDFHIIPVQDIHRYDLWVRHVESLCPPFDEVWAHSPFTKELFEEAGYPVKGYLVDHESVISGTELREIMIDRVLSDDDWKEFVPQGTVNVVESLDLIRRMFNITAVEKRYR